ncbi:MAG: glycosyltransferase [Candidatus Omnitrophica bacterium]|nr:glycosyltransferase [Candidatus Omnitrophota bacterium]
MYKPLVSILIPCYNKVQWIGQAIESALSQTYSNKEIIVVDDGSADRSPEVIQAFGNKVQWEAGPNRGANAARNRLLELSRGEWLQYLDADDYLLPDKLERQINNVDNINDVDVVYSQILLETKEGESIVRKSAEEINPIKKETDIFVNFAKWSFPQTGGVLFKRQTLIEIGGWKEEQPCCQEHELYLRLLMAGKKFVFCKDEDAVYRLIEEKTLSRKDPLKTIKERMRITNTLENWLYSHSMLDPKRQETINISRFECARKAYESDKKLADALIKKIKQSNSAFIPSGNAAPPAYRLLYRMFGFSVAESIGIVKRKIFKGREV